MRSRRIKIILFFVFAALTVAFCFNSPVPELMLLNHSATILAGIFLIFVMLRDNISTWSFKLILVFTLLHSIGAKWTYIYVPYDEWYQWLTGSTLSEIFGWERNNYDRWVHFAYGLLIWYPAKEIFQKWYGYKLRQATFAAWMFIAASSMLYELFEWALTVVAASETAEHYNGQQGDFWDAQKDMALASGGAILAWIINKISRLVRR
ncbi:MAG: DUF2238 domain-containing protein [Marinilabiliales bacterium]|nr:MAG: DUF2238 domain-containing protein [Marinilabiliales bacterium]